MGKLIDLTGLGEFKTKLLNLIKPQLDASVSTVNDKSATNHAVVINADDIKMSSSENVTIPNKLKQYVKSVNGSTPDPITGDVVVAGGGGDTSVGLIRRSIGIPAIEWQGSGPFTYTYRDPDIAAGMCVLEAYLSDEYAQLGVNNYTIQDESLIISTTVKPTDDWNLTVALGMDGSSFMEDVSDLKTKVGNGTIDTTATTLIGAVNELNARKGSGITVSDTDSRSIATAISEQAAEITDLGPYNGLDSNSTIAALSALQGRILNDKVFPATNVQTVASIYTDSWLLSAKNGIYKSTGGSATGSIIEGAENTYGVLLIFSPFTFDAVSSAEEYCTLLFADSNNSLYHRNFYRQKSTETILWRGPLKKITTN